MKTYLITGGAGFIGSNYILNLLREDCPNNDVRILMVDSLTYAGNLANLKSLENDPRYLFVQADIGDRNRIEALFAEYEIDFVVNFAAESHVDRSILNPAIFAETNIMGTMNLLQCAFKSWHTSRVDVDSYKDGVKFLQVSTDEVYGSLGLTGLFTESTPLNPHSPYSASKASADMLVKAFFDTYGFPVNITRCSNNYGPYQFPEKLIPLIINNARQHKPLPVYGDGLQVRDWLYVKDHCRALDHVLERGKLGEVYNIGGNNERTNIRIVEIVIELLSQKLNDPMISMELIQHVTDRKGHDRRYGIDPAKIHTQLGWQPETPFELGIDKTIDWYLENESWIQNIVSGEYRDYYDRMYGLS